jgi:hypothetical protein
MANSLHLQLRNAIATMLVAGGIAEGRVHKNRQLQLGTAVDSQVHVNFRRSQPEEVVVYSDHPRDWTTDIEIVILARKFNSVEASDVADAMWVQLYGIVMADQSLGGLAAYLEPGEVAVDDVEGDTSLCKLTWIFSVQHRTDHNSISS